jgi:phage terminase large subunit GpA-like protein
MLTTEVTAEPGPWRNERTPYLVGIMDAIEDAEEIVVLKAAQVGFSECVRNLLGYWIDHDPGPCLVVMPNQKSAEELIVERVMPLVHGTPAVARHKTDRAWDVKKHAIRLDTMSIYLAWAGSSQGMKSRPIRYLLLDEPDEYPAVSGAGGDPISKALKRVTTYQSRGKSRLVLGGTPTTRRGNVWAWWESCTVKHHAWAPCPKCGTWQTLVWSRVKYRPANDDETRQRHAERVRTEAGAAWYECERCEAPWSEADRRQSIARCVWAGEDQAVVDGRIVGEVKRGRRVGFKLTALLSPWVSLATLAGEWIEAQDDVQKLCDFINQRLAEPFEERTAKTESSVISNKAAGAGPAGVVPDWAQWLIATADTQGMSETDGYFYWTVRAWAQGARSQLVDFGVAHSKAELTAILDKPYQCGGRVVTPSAMLVDSGGPRWLEVYEMAMADRRVVPVKGSNQYQAPVVTERPQKRHGVVLWEIGTDRAKDTLNRLINDADVTRWMPHSGINADYVQQMSSEARVFNPQTGREEWIEVVKKSNHFWDCEVYQVAAAYRVGAFAAEAPATPQQQAPTDSTRRVNPLDYKGKW